MDELIDRIQRRCAARRDVLSLAGGLPAFEALPRAELRRAAARALEDPKARALQYGWPEGDTRLRTWVARRLTERGRPVATDDVLITAGAQQGLAIAAEVLRPEVRSVGVPDACYPGALDSFRGLGLELTGDDAGEALYVMAGVGNPTGEAPDEPCARGALGRGVPVIVDEAYAELAFDGRIEIAEAHRDARTWLVGTMSKTLAPGLRVGWLVPPRSHRELALEKKREIDLETSSMGQEITAHLLAELDYDEHLGRLRQLYARRAASLAQAVARWLPSFQATTPRGGFSLWIDTGVEGDDVGLLERAMTAGTSFDPGRSFERVPGRTITMRLSYSNLDEATLPEAVRRLAIAWRA